MAEARDSETLNFYQPTIRGVFDLRAIHVPRRLARTIGSQPYILKVDHCFDAVIEACAVVERPDGNTWINTEIQNAFSRLHALGHAHCISAHLPDGELVGGLYGLHLGSIFFGESMFSRARDASKICFVGLCAALSQAKFSHVDAQMSNPHLHQFGLQEWDNEQFLRLLPVAIERTRHFPDQLSSLALPQFLQATTHTS